MGSADMKNLWMYLHRLEDKVETPEVVPHEETDLHRVFCDEHFCVERGPAVLVPAGLGAGSLEASEPRD